MARTVASAPLRTAYGGLSLLLVFPRLRQHRSSTYHRDQTEYYGRSQLWTRIQIPFHPLAPATIASWQTYFALLLLLTSGSRLDGANLGKAS